ADQYVLGRVLGEPDALAVFSQYYVMLAATLVMAVLGIPILRDALRSLTSLRASVDPLIAVGAFSAYAASVVAFVRGGETYFDTATMILIFVTLGRFLEARGRASAERPGAALGIADVRWSLLPHEKVAALQAASAGSASRRVAMVGDGINDAAALAAADVGIATCCGADVAREAADVAMVGGDLTQIPWLLRFSRRVRRTVATNLMWSFAYNTAGIGLALTGWLPPVLAAMAMVLSSLFVIGNTRRLSRHAVGAVTLRIATHEET
ncbi:MAG: HAD family hydrolase, partial [Candidatus Rokubacteria bacterium]|nr:HAD family hydrolase [Candidatus Rokubacteria bacterium]